MKNLIKYLAESIKTETEANPVGNLYPGNDIANVIFNIMEIIDPDLKNEYENCRKEGVECINNYIQNTLKNKPKTLIYFSNALHSRFNDADVEKGVMDNIPNDCPFKFKLYKKVSTTYDWQIEQEYMRAKNYGTYTMQSAHLDIKDAVFGGKPALYIDFGDIIFLIR